MYIFNIFKFSRFLLLTELLINLIVLFQRFIDDPDMVNRIRKTFAGLYSLDNVRYVLMDSYLCSEFTMRDATLSCVIHVFLSDSTRGQEREDGDRKSRTLCR